MEKTGEACSSAPPAAREVEVGPSTGGKAADSGSGSGSWQKFLNVSSDNEGNSSSAPNEGRQPEGDGATSQPTGVMEPAPCPLTPSETKAKLEKFLSSFSQKRKPAQSFIERKVQELYLERAWPEKLAKMVELREFLSQNRERFSLNSAQNAAAQLIMMMEEWEKYFRGD